MASASFDFEFGGRGGGVARAAAGALDEDDDRAEEDLALAAFPLTQMTLGVWKARAHGGLRFLLARRSFVFVVFRRRRAVSRLARASDFALNLVNKAMPSSRLVTSRVPTSPFNLEWTSSSSASASEAAAASASTPRADAAVPGTPTDDAAVSGGTPSFVAGVGFTPPRGARQHQHQRSTTNHLVLTFEVKFEDLVGMDYKNPLCEDGRVAIEARAVTKRAFADYDAALAFFEARDRRADGGESNRNARWFFDASGGAGSAVPVRGSSGRRSGDRDRAARRRLGGGSGGSGSGGLRARERERTPPPAAEEEEEEEEEDDDDRGGGGGVARKRSRGVLEPSFAAVDTKKPFMPFAVKPPAEGMEDGASTDAAAAAAASPPKTPREDILRRRLTVDTKTKRATPPIPETASDGNFVSDTTMSDTTPAARISHTPPFDTPAGYRNDGNNAGKAASRRARVGFSPEASRFKPAAVGGDNDSSRASSSSRASTTAPATASCVFLHRTIIACFDDPDLPAALRRKVTSRQRLLRLYESGLPPWALLLPSFGFYYRPYLRGVARALFALVSVLSMLAGFYDLYKNIPGFGAVLTRALGPFVTFLETHASTRLAVLASYLFTQSAIFAPLMARLSPLLRVGRSATAAVYRPLVELFGGAWGDVVAVVTVATSPLRAAFAAAARLFGVVAASSPALRTVFAPIAAASKGVARVASAATAVTVTVTAAGGGGGGGAASSFAWWLDARLWREFGVYVFRATQRAANVFAFALTAALRHRRSSQIATRRWWRRTRAKWAAAKNASSPTGSDGHEKTE